MSDNEAAEVLAHHVGLAVAGEGSFEGGRAGVAETLAGLGVDLAGERVYDGSGLSRRSRLQLDTLVDVLRVAASPEHPELRAVVSGLPVAGFTGSLELRFDEAAAPGAGVVRAKTGTLTGVSGLAGLVTDAEGRPWSSRPWPTRSPCSTPSTPAMPSTASPPTSPPAAAPPGPTRARSLQLPPALGSGHDERRGRRADDHGRLGDRGGAGSRIAGDGPAVDAAAAAAVVAELRSGADRSTGLVREFTGLHAAERSAPVLVVDRAGWVRANAQAFSTIIEPVAAKLTEKKGPPSGLSRAVGSKITGAEVGLLLGFLGGKVLGQFDPFAEPAGRLLLVAPNIVHVERELEADPSDFRLWVCLHEETHRVQFTAVPWMRDHMFAEIGKLVDTVEARGPRRATRSARSPTR